MTDMLGPFLTSAVQQRNGSVVVVASGQVAIAVRCETCGTTCCAQVAGGSIQFICPCGKQTILVSKGA